MRRLMGCLLCFSLAACDGDREWREFSAQHGCQSVEHHSPRRISKNMILPGYDIWLCDDGKQYRH